MALYIVTGNYTAAAMKGMMASPSDREEAARSVVEAAGGKVQAYYLTSGETDFLIVTEANDAKDILPALMVTGGSGTVSNLKTVMAFTSADFTAAQKKAGEIAGKYKAAT